MTVFFFILTLIAEPQFSKPTVTPIAMTTTVVEFASMEQCEAVRGQLQFLAYGVSGIPVGTGSQYASVGALISPQCYQK